MGALIKAIQFASSLATIILLADIITHYFLDPSHPVREALDGIVKPFLDPIRRVLPQTGMIDLSPLVLWFLIQIVETILINILAPMT